MYGVGFLVVGCGQIVERKHAACILPNSINRAAGCRILESHHHQLVTASPDTLRRENGVVLASRPPFFPQITSISLNKIVVLALLSVEN